MVSAAGRAQEERSRSRRQLNAASRQEPAEAGPCRIQEPLASAERGWTQRRAARPRFAVTAPLPRGEPAKRLVHPYVFHPLRIPAHGGGSPALSLGLTTAA
jgi:hypothetical protein